MIRLRYILGGLTVCVTCLHPHSLPAQPWIWPGQLASADVGIGLSETAYGPNPASRGRSTVMTGVIREFALPQLTSSTLLVGQPSVGLAMRHLAFSSYSESAFDLTGRIAISRWKLGTRLQQTLVRPNGFRARWSTEMTTGALLSLDGSTVGLTLTRERLGLGWSAVRKFWSLALDVHSTPTGLASGASWSFTATPAITLLGGVSTNPSRLGLGVDLSVSRWRISMGLQRHLVLGWSTGLAIGWG